MGKKEDMYQINGPVEGEASAEKENIIIVQAAHIPFYQKLPEAMRRGLQAFSDRELELHKSVKRRGRRLVNLTSYEREMINATMRNIQGFRYLRDLFEFPYLHPEAHSIVIVSAQDGKSEEVVGFSTAVVYEGKITKKAENVYVGVRTDPRYLRKGLATTLVLIRSRILDIHGVHLFKTSVWEGSLGVYNKLSESGGISFNVDRDNLHPSDRFDIKQLNVTIDRNRLRKVFQDFGLDSTQDPFQPYHLKI